MVKLLLESIAQEALDLNIAKEGYTAYYVDGEDGLDIYPGDSWLQPFRTIQHAVDEAESWAKIFIKSLTNSNMAVNAAAAQPDVTVVDATGFTDGDIVIVRDDNLTERATILSIAGNVLTMTVNLTNAYTTADNGIVIHVYNENVAIDKSHVSLIGEDRDTTIVSSGSGDTIDTSTGIEDCEVCGLGCVAHENLRRAIRLRGEGHECHDCAVDTSSANIVIGVLVGGDYIKIYNVKTVTPQLNIGIGGGGDHGEIHHCQADGNSVGIVVTATTVNFKIHENDVSNCTIGIEVDTGSSDVSIYHNNLISNTTQVVDDDAASDWFENYYDDHTTDTNNDGLCDTPYTFTTGTDYQPVSRRNGWKQESLGTTSSSAITIANIFAAVNAILTLTETGGTLTTDGNEQNLYINNAPAGVFDPKIVQIDFTNQTAAETVVIREYYRINSGGGLIKKDERTFTGVQDPLLKNVVLEPNRFGVRVTMEKTVGANQAYDFEAVYKI